LTPPEEKATEAARGRLDVGRVEQRADHRNGVRPCLDDGMRVFGRDASDRDNGRTEARLCFAIK